MPETKKKKRRAYLDSFRKNEEGRYDYTGNVYYFAGNDIEENNAEGNDFAGNSPERNGFRGNGEALRPCLMKLWLLGAVLLGCLIAAGCISVPGMDNCFYVLLPYAAALMAGISVLWALGRMTAGGNPLKEYVYQASVEKLPERAVMTVFFAAAAAAGEAVYICLHGAEGKPAGFCVFMLLNFAAAGAALMLRREIKTMKWIKHGNLQ